MSISFIFLSFVSLLKICDAYVTPNLSKLPTFSGLSPPPMKFTPPLLLLTPSIVLADDGNQSAFLIPLAISVLTMVPFLWYQQ
jgi:hypothetical protein